MITALLIAAAAAVLYSDQIKAWLTANAGKLPRLEPKHWLAVGLVAVGVVMWQPRASEGEPTIVPEAASPLDLRGLFTGPRAADDAAALSALCDELAAAIEWDGMQEKPRLATGWNVADLRAVARDVRMKGQTFGDLQPRVRDAVKAYLDRPEILGKSGGPLGPKDRAKWVTAFRDIARAAEAAIK